MKIYQLSIFVYILSINLLNAFYLRKEADENFILLNDNIYHDNYIIESNLNLRYISSGVLRKLQTPPEIMRKLPISGENVIVAQNSGRVGQFPSIKENNAILNINSIYTFNKLKRKKKIYSKKKILNQNRIIDTSPIKRMELKSISTVPIVENTSIFEKQYNLTAHNSINIKCVLIKNINRKTCTSPTIFDRTDITPSNKMNQLYHDYYYIHLDNKEKEFIKKFCRNYTNIDINYKSIDYYSQTYKIYKDLDKYTLIDNLLIGTTLYIIYFAVSGNFNGIVLFMTLSMFLITINGIQNSLKNR